MSILEFEVESQSFFSNVIIYYCIKLFSPKTIEALSRKNQKSSRSVVLILRVKKKKKNEFHYYSIKYYQINKAEYIIIIYFYLH